MFPTERCTNHLLGVFLHTASSCESAGETCQIIPPLPELYEVERGFTKNDYSTCERVTQTNLALTSLAREKMRKKAAEAHTPRPMCGRNDGVVLPHDTVIGGVAGLVTWFGGLGAHVPLCRAFASDDCKQLSNGPRIPSVEGLYRLRFVVSKGGLGRAQGCSGFSCASPLSRRSGFARSASDGHHVMRRDTFGSSGSTSPRGLAFRRRLILARCRWCAALSFDSVLPAVRALSVPGGMLVDKRGCDRAKCYSTYPRTLHRPLSSSQASQSTIICHVSP